MRKSGKKENIFNQILQTTNIRNRYQNLQSKFKYATIEYLVVNQKAQLSKMNINAAWLEKKKLLLSASLKTIFKDTNRRIHHLK